MGLVSNARLDKLSLPVGDVTAKAVAPGWVELASVQAHPLNISTEGCRQHGGLGQMQDDNARGSLPEGLRGRVEATRMGWPGAGNPRLLPGLPNQCEW